MDLEFCLLIMANKKMTSREAPGITRNHLAEKAFLSMKNTRDRQRKRIITSQIEKSQRSL